MRIIHLSLALAIACGGDSDDTAVTPDAGPAPTFPNMFAARACLADAGSHARDEYCPGGAAADFDADRFARLYRDLDDTALYPDAGAGPYERRALPICVDGTSPADGVCATGEPIRCTDGTRPVAYVRMPNAASIHAKDWLVRVQGGGFSCGTHPRETNCYAMDENDFSSGRTNLRRDIGGIFNSADIAGAPPFRDWGAVFIDKCVGDRNTGDSALHDYPYYEAVAGVVKNGALEAAGSLVGRGEVYFHGRRVLAAVVNELVNNGRLAAGSRLAFVVHSNASNGLYQYIDELARFVDTAAGVDVDVRGVASSMLRSTVEIENFLNGGGVADYSEGGTVDAPLSTRARFDEYNDLGYTGKYRFSDGDKDHAADGAQLSMVPYRPGGIEHQRFADWGAEPDASCKPSREVCLEPVHVAVRHLQTPVFFAVQLSDHAVRNGFNHFADPAGTPEPPGELAAAYHPVDFAARVNAAIDQIDALDAGHAVFATATDDHDSVEVNRKVERTIGGLGLADALYDWLTSPAGDQTICVARTPTGDVPWVHVDDGYEDTGADPAHTCAGATF